MKYETSKLVGLKPDQAVAKALGASPPFAPGKCRDVVGLIDTPPYEYDDDFLPSSIWAHGGPIIDREGIELWKWNGDGGEYWCSHVGGRRIDTADKESFGETSLVAAMRAFVTAKLGAEVDL